MLIPMPWNGAINMVSDSSLAWLQQLPKNTYCALWQGWPSKKNYNLPTNYDLYIVSFHLEAVDIEWIVNQAARIQAPIIILSDSNYYNWAPPTNVHCYTYYYWHKQFQKIQQWYGIQPQQKKNYKFSAVCNRISQSKIWVTTKLLETARDDSLIVVNDWLEEKNVHGWQPTGNNVLDQLTEKFRTTYYGQKITIDNFNSITSNYQSITSNPWQPLYSNTAIHFTNESFHYSLMNDVIYPGPFITEKTLKCLIGGTAFIPAGQFETYRTLEKLGFNFDYKFNTKWDLDPGNITRFHSIITLIDEMSQQSIEELVDCTNLASQHNQNHVYSGEFYQRCQDHNEKIIQNIVDKWQ